MQLDRTLWPVLIRCNTSHRLSWTFYRIRRRRRCILHSGGVDMCSNSPSLRSCTDVCHNSHCVRRKWRTVLFHHNRSDRFCCRLQLVRLVQILHTSGGSLDTSSCNSSLGDVCRIALCHNMRYWRRTPAAVWSYNCNTCVSWRCMERYHSKTMCCILCMPLSHCNTPRPVRPSKAQ